MKRNIFATLLFGTIAFFATSLGFFRASQNQPQKAKADTYPIEVKDEIATFGLYPQKLMYTSQSTVIEEQGEIIRPNVYKYNDKYYTRIDSCLPYTGSVMLDENVSTGQIFEQKVYFEWQPITWYVLKEEGGLTYFYSKFVIDTLDWQRNIDGSYISGTTTPANDWENSLIRQYLNNEFYEYTFNDEEKTIVKEFTLPAEEHNSGKQLLDKAGLITKTELDKHSKFLNAKGTSYAYAKSLQYALDGTLTKSFYYLNSATNNPSDFTKVDCASGKDTSISKEVNVTATYTECGIRPFVAVDSGHITRPGTHGGGGGTIYVNVSLILGIIFGILGIAGVTVLLILWKRIFPLPKGPIMLIVFICISFIISVVGVSMIFANTGGLGSGYSQRSPIGYFSTPEFTLDTYSQEFGYRYFYGLDSKHNVYRYYADMWEDGINNYTLHPYSGVGSWQLKGRKLIITASTEWKLFEWEEEVTTYYPTNAYGFGLDAMIMNEGNQDNKGYVVSGYRWYHSSTVEPTGQEVTAKEAGLYHSNWVNKV